jgi:K+-sensing histidine kinase KdpD
MLQAVAHDVKNKLAELALRLFNTDAEAAALALDSADKLSQALLLDSPDQLVAHIDSAAPSDLVDELAAVNRQLFPSKRIAVDISAAPVLWYYDVTLMRLALSNAVHNALKNCNEGIVMRAYADTNSLVFEIRDDGTGFDEALLRTDWNAHEHPHVSPSQTGQHIYRTGLGLLLAHKILVAHALEKDGGRRTGAMNLSNDNGAVVRLSVP